MKNQNILCADTTYKLKIRLVKFNVFEFIYFVRLTTYIIKPFIVFK